MSAGVPADVDFLIDDRCLQVAPQTSTSSSTIGVCRWPCRRRTTRCFAAAVSSPPPSSTDRSPSTVKNAVVYDPSRRHLDTFSLNHRASTYNVRVVANPIDTLTLFPDQHLSSQAHAISGTRVWVSAGVPADVHAGPFERQGILHAEHTPSESRILYSTVSTTFGHI